MYLLFDQGFTLTPTYAQRIMRQALDADYYYPEASDAELALLPQHTRKSALFYISSDRFDTLQGHCLEVLRTALLCQPDLNPHSYGKGLGERLDIKVSGKGTRKCVDWDALRKLLAQRRVSGKMLMLDTGPVF